MISIFKYRPVDKFTFSNISESKFIMSRPESFNDPFDSFFNVMFLANWDLKTPYQPKPKIEGQFVPVYIASFSAVKDNTLMWAHYADGHRGICFEIEIDEENPIYDDCFLKKVEYVTDLTQTMKNPIGYMADEGRGLNSFNDTFKRRFAETIARPGMVQDAVLDAISKKQIHWKYEAEYRFIKIPKRGKKESKMKEFITFPKIKRVLLGIKIDENDKRNVIEMAKSKNIVVNQMVYSSEKLIIADYQNLAAD